MLWARGFLLLGFSSSASTSSWESLLHLTLGAGNVVFVTLAGVAKYAMKHWMQQRLELQTKVPGDTMSFTITEKAPSWGLLRDCEIFANLSITFVWSSSAETSLPCDIPYSPRTSTRWSIYWSAWPKSRHCFIMSPNNVEQLNGSHEDGGSLNSEMCVKQTSWLGYSLKWL